MYLQKMYHKKKKNFTSLQSYFIKKKKEKEEKQRENLYIYIKIYIYILYTIYLVDIFIL